MFYQMFTEHRLFKGSALFYDAIVTPYIEGLYFIAVYGKKRPIAILWHHLNISGGSVFHLTGGGGFGNHPLSLVNRVTEKSLVRRGLNTEQYLLQINQNPDTICCIRMTNCTYE